MSRGILQRIDDALAPFRLIFELVTDLSVADDGTWSGEGVDNGDLAGVMGYHFGFQSRPRDGFTGVCAKLGADGTNSILFAFRDSQYEITLQKGEVAMVSAAGAVHLLDKDGGISSVPAAGQKVRHGATSGTQPSVLGNALETRLADLEAKFLTHQHIVNTTSGCTAGGASATGSAVHTASVLPHSGDVIKSSIVEVAP